MSGAQYWLEAQGEDTGCPHLHTAARAYRGRAHLWLDRLDHRPPGAHRGDRARRWAEWLRGSPRAASGEPHHRRRAVSAAAAWPRPAGARAALGAVARAVAARLAAGRAVRGRRRAVGP